MADEMKAPESSVPWPSPRKAWYAVGIVTLVLTLNFLDRGIVGLLNEPIKHDLGLSDTELGALGGLAFAVFYAIVGLPIARLADSKSRRLIIGIGLATWSAMTALCGLATNFLQLFAARVGVGVGEACNGPATFSLLGDLFPREKLGRAIAVLNFGFVAGTGIAAILGAAVYEWVSNLPPVTLPIVGTARPWQLTFLLVGLPGLAVALLLRTIVEPARRGRMTGPAAASPGKPVGTIPVRDVVAFVVKHRATYGPLFLGLAMQTVLSFGTAFWLVSFFVRTYGWTIPQAGLAQGLVILCAWPIGLVPGSLLAEWLAKRGYDDANLRVTVIALVAYIPFTILLPLMPSAPLAVTMLALQGFFVAFSIGPQNAALQTVTPGEIRGQITALQLFVFNIVGFGLGPMIVGALTHNVFHDDSKLRYSLVIVAATLGPLAAYVLWSGRKAYAERVVASRAWK